MFATTRRSILALALAAATPALNAAEWRVGTGVYLLSDDGIDLHLSVRPEESRWQFGVRALRYTDVWQTGAGTPVGKTTTMMVGPQLNYLFSPGSARSWYVGVSVMRWTQDETSARTGTRGRTETTAPFFGGGYSGRMGKLGYYNLGAFFSPAKLSTQTADTAEESTGADMQLQLGFAF